MPDKCVSIQIQSILYHNEPESIRRAVECVALAAACTRRVGLAGGYSLGPVAYLHGDASATPVFTEAEYAALQGQYSDILTLDCDIFGENTGHSKGQNRLAAQGDSDYIMVLNPDVLVEPHIFEHLLNPFLDGTHPALGIAEARQSPLEHHKAFDIATGETAWACGACIVFPRAVFHKVGGFDHESFFMYCDDVDFSWRVRLAGYRILYVPKAAAYHAKHMSAAGEWLPTAAEAYYSAEAALLMAHKWSNPARVKELLAAFDVSKDENQQKAAAAFRSREKEGRLPAPLDPEHSVAAFSRYGYGAYRFHYD